MYVLANSVLLKAEEKTELYLEDCLKTDVQQITPLEIERTAETPNL